MIKSTSLRVKSIRILLAGLLFLLPALCLCFSNTILADQESKVSNPVAYTFGVFPFLPASRLEGVFAPIAAELGQALDRRVKYRSTSTFTRFMKRLANQEFEIAFIQPFDYVRIAARAGYLPVVKRKESLYAIFVVKEDSPYQSILDLKGHTVAMAPKMAALSYMGRITLMEAGFDLKQDITIKYCRGHHSCLQQVAIGNASACVTGRPALRVFKAKTRLRLKVLEKTPSIPQVLIVVHARVPGKNREAIKKTLLNTTLKGVAPELRTLLTKDGNNPFIPVLDSDYDQVRQYWETLENR